MLGILGVFLQAAAGHILYLALHLESGSFPRPLTPAQERDALAALQQGGAARTQARDTLIRHNLRLVAHIAKKYFSAAGSQEDMVSIGCIGLIKAVDTYDACRARKFSSYASRCIENELRMELRRRRREGATVSLQEPLEGGGDANGAPLTLADTLQDDADMTQECENRSEWAQLRRDVQALPPRERRVLELRYGLGGGAPLTQQQTAEQLKISRSYVSRLEKRALTALQQKYILPKP